MWGTTTERRSTHINRLDLAKLFKQIGEILLSGLFVHLAHPQSCTAHLTGSDNKTSSRKSSERKKSKVRFWNNKPSRTTQSLRSYWRQSFLLPFLFPLPCTSFTGVRPGRFPLAVSRAWARPLAVLPLPWARARPGPSPLWRPTEKILTSCKFFPVFQIQSSEHQKPANYSIFQPHWEKLFFRNQSDWPRTWPWMCSWACAHSFLFLGLKALLLQAIRTLIQIHVLSQSSHYSPSLYVPLYNHLSFLSHWSSIPAAGCLWSHPVCYRSQEAALGCCSVWMQENYLGQRLSPALQ